MLFKFQVLLEHGIDDRAGNLHSRVLLLQQKLAAIVEGSAHANEPAKDLPLIQLQVLWPLT